MCARLAARWRAHASLAHRLVLSLFTPTRNELGISHTTSHGPHAMPSMALHRRRGPGPRSHGCGSPPPSAQPRPCTQSQGRPRLSHRPTIHGATPQHCVRAASAAPTLAAALRTTAAARTAAQTLRAVHLAERVVRRSRNHQNDAALRLSSHTIRLHPVSPDNIVNMSNRGPTSYPLDAQICRSYRCICDARTMHAITSYWASHTYALPH